MSYRSCEGIMEKHELEERLHEIEARLRLARRVGFIVAGVFLVTVVSLSIWAWQEQQKSAASAVTANEEAENAQESAALALKREGEAKEAQTKAQESAAFALKREGEANAK